MAMYCAQKTLSKNKIAQLQDQIFEPDQKAKATQIMARDAEQVVVDFDQFECD